MILSSIKSLLLTLFTLSLAQCGIKKDTVADFEQDGPHTHLKKEEAKKQP